MKCLGGKRGFESLIRKEALNRRRFHDDSLARELNGRMVRDVREETRMKNWIEGREERDKLDRERKIRKEKDTF